MARGKKKGGGGKMHLQCAPATREVLSRRQPPRFCFSPPTKWEHVFEIHSVCGLIGPDVFVSKDAVEKRPFVIIRDLCVGGPLEQVPCHFQRVVLGAGLFRMRPEVLVISRRVRQQRRPELGGLCNSDGINIARVSIRRRQQGAAPREQ